MVSGVIHSEEETSMPHPTPAVVGLDIAKNVFQVHGADAMGHRVLRRRLRRGEVAVFFARLPPCLVGIEACPGAHHWARELQALGHEVRLIPPQYVKPFVKTNKTDAADAEAIREAVVRPTMRFVPVKTAEQQAATMLHRTRALLVRQRTQLINAVRGHLAEFGLVAPKGTRNLRELAGLVHGTAASVLPEPARCSSSSSSRSGRPRPASPTSSGRSRPGRRGPTPAGA
jgi:transposase